MMDVVSGVDAYVLHVLYAARVLQVSYVFIGFSEMATLLVVSGLVACASLMLFLVRRYAEIAGLLVAVSGAGATTLLLKLVFERPRPDTYFRAYPEFGYSFPSGHATAAMVLYGFFGILVIRLAPAKYHRPAAIFLGFLIVMIGFSRLYLGVHYLSDVVVGFIVGGLFLLVGHWTMQKLTSILRTR